RSVLVVDEPLEVDDLLPNPLRIVAVIRGSDREVSRQLRTNRAWLEEERVGVAGVEVHVEAHRKRDKDIPLVCTEDVPRDAKRVVLAASGRLDERHRDPNGASVEPDLVRRNLGLAAVPEITVVHPREVSAVAIVLGSTRRAAVPVLALEEYFRVRVVG